MSNSSKSTSRREKHGGSYTPEHKSWAHLKDRCTNTKSPDYPRYGGRGVYVCPRWLGSFAAFLAAVGPRPSPQHSIDRIDTNGSYTCGTCEDCSRRGATMNCRWATKKTQARNRRQNHHLTWNGVTRTIGEWTEVTGLPYNTILNRQKLGWSVQDTLATPSQQPIYLEYGGDRLALEEWAKKLGVHRDALYARRRRGWPVWKILGFPPV